VADRRGGRPMSTDVRWRGYYVDMDGRIMRCDNAKQLPLLLRL